MKLLSKLKKKKPNTGQARYQVDEETTPKNGSPKQPRKERPSVSFEAPVKGKSSEPFESRMKEEITAEAGSEAPSGKFEHAVKLHGLVDLADEEQDIDHKKAKDLRSHYKVLHPSFNQSQYIRVFSTEDSSDTVSMIRANLPPDPLLNTPFGTRRMTYADYTASGRSLHFIEEYMRRVIGPMYANTHTETSASGLQTTHAREEARSIIMKSLDADPKEYALIFTGTGSTGAIWKLIAMLGIHCPYQLLPHLDKSKIKKVLVFCSQSEHHSNELMWRETIADVIPIPPDSTGSLSLEFLESMLEENKGKYDLVIGSFTAGSNVTGLTTKPGPVASLLHKYGAYACFDYAGAGPYKQMKMSPNTEGDPQSYLDAIYISPHKFVGGPGTPGLLCVRKEFATCCKDKPSRPPTIAGGGTVLMVWPSDVEETADSNRVYETDLQLCEEAGTPGVMESIRCGLVFHVRDIVGPTLIEELEGRYATEAVRRMQERNVWVMGDIYSNITSHERLSITSFNIFCKLPDYENDLTGPDALPGVFVHPTEGRPLMLHFHFVAALLNDLYGIQARSGCACAGPLAFRLFGARYPFMTKEAIDRMVALAEKQMHCLKPGFCRVNFNYFIDKEEFDYIMAAIEQIAEHGWKLLPLYALCMKTGQYWYNGVHEDDDGNYKSFNRFDSVRTIKELQFEKDGSFGWNECRFSTDDRQKYLEEAKAIYDCAPELVRKMLFRFRDLRRRDMSFPDNLQKYRFFVLGSEVLPFLGITKEERRKEATTLLAKSKALNPDFTAFPEHPTANPWLTMDRPRG